MGYWRPVREVFQTTCTGDQWTLMKWTWRGQLPEREPAPWRESSECPSLKATGAWEKTWSNELTETILKQCYSRMKCAPYYSPALASSGSFAVGFNGRRPVGFSEAVLISALRWRDRASREMIPVTAEASPSSCPPGSTPSLLLLGCHRGWVWPWLAAARQRRSALAQAGRISAKNSSCLLLERLPPCR